jgi:hypothetical protein
MHAAREVVGCSPMFGCFLQQLVGQHWRMPWVPELPLLLVPDGRGMSPFCDGLPRSKPLCRNQGNAQMTRAFGRVSIWLRAQLPDQSAVWLRAQLPDQSAVRASWCASWCACCAWCSILGQLHSLCNLGLCRCRLHRACGRVFWHGRWWCSQDARMSLLHPHPRACSTFEPHQVERRRYSQACNTSIARSRHPHCRSLHRACGRARLFWRW